MQRTPVNLSLLTVLTTLAAALLLTTGCAKTEESCGGPAGYVSAGLGLPTALMTGDRSLHILVLDGRDSQCDCASPRDAIEGLPILKEASIDMEAIKNRTARIDGIPVGEDRILLIELVQDGSVEPIARGCRSGILIRENEVTQLGFLSLSFEPIRVGGHPQEVLFSRDLGKRAYLLCDDPLSTGTLRVLDTDLESAGFHDPDMEVIPLAYFPMTMAISNKGDVAYAINKHGVDDQGETTDDGNLLVIDFDPASPTFHQILGEAQVGYIPTDVMVHPDGERVYTTNFSRIPGLPGWVSVFDVSDLTVPNLLDRILVGAGPSKLDVTPDGLHALSLNSLAESVNRIDISNDVWNGHVGVGSLPVEIAVHPNNRYAYVCNGGDVSSTSKAPPLPDTITIIDLINFEAEEISCAGLTPIDIAVTSNGTYAYIMNYGSGDISVLSIDPFNPDFHRVVDVIHGVEGSFTPYPVLALSPDNRLLIAINGISSSAVIIDTDPESPTFNEILDTIPIRTHDDYGHLVYPKPQSLAVSPDNTRAYILAEHAAAETFYCFSFTIAPTLPFVLQTISTSGAHPMPVTFDSERGVAYVPHLAPLSNFLSIIDIDAVRIMPYRSEIGSIGVHEGRLSTFLALSTDFDRAYLGTFCGKAEICGDEKAIDVFDLSAIDTWEGHEQEELFSAKLLIDGRPIWMEILPVGPEGRDIIYLSTQQPSILYLIDAIDIEDDPASAVLDSLAIDTPTDLMWVIAVLNEGRRGFIATTDGVAVVDFDPLDGEITGLAGSIPTGIDSNGLSLSSDRLELYVTSGNDRTLSIVDVELLDVSADFGESIISTIQLGSSPGSVTSLMTPDGERLFVADTLANKVYVVDAGLARIGSDSAVVETISVGRNPYSVRLSPSGLEVFVSNLFADSISVIINQ